MVTKTSSPFLRQVARFDSLVYRKRVVIRTTVILLGLDFTFFTSRMTSSSLSGQRKNIVSK
jgi:hypothetical protein